MVGSSDNYNDEHKMGCEAGRRLLLAVGWWSCGGHWHCRQLGSMVVESTIVP